MLVEEKGLAKLVKKFYLHAFYSSMGLESSNLSETQLVGYPKKKEYYLENNDDKLKVLQNEFMAKE